MSAVGQSLLQLLAPPLEKEDRSADRARVGRGDPTVILPPSCCEARRAIERRFPGIMNPIYCWFLMLLLSPLLLLLLLI